MKNNPTNSSNSTVKIAGQVLVLAAGLCFNPSLSTDVLSFEHKKNKTRRVSEPSMACNKTTVSIGQQFIPPNDGVGPDDDLFDSFDIDATLFPSSEFSVRANVVSVQKGDLQPVVLDDVFYLD